MHAEHGAKKYIHTFHYTPVITGFFSQQLWLGCLFKITAKFEWARRRITIYCHFLDAKANLSIHIS